MIDESDDDLNVLEESGDPWPDEPDEFDPSNLGPEIPSAPDPSTGEVDASPELLRAFWAAVLFANVGLLGVSLGPMLIFLDGRTDLGLSVFLVGVVGLLFCYRQYHGYMNRDDRDDTDEDDTEPATEPGASGHGRGPDGGE